MRQMMHASWSKLNFGAIAISEDMFQWNPRDYNTIADELADIGCLVGNRIIEHKPIKPNSKFFRVHFDGSSQEGKIGGGWCLEQAWAREGNLPLWKPAMKVAISICTASWPAYAIVAETIACQEAMCAVLTAVGVGHITMTPKCRVLRQGILANSN